MLVLYERPPLRLDSLVGSLRDACKQPSNQPITVKWIDDEGEEAKLKTIGMIED